MIIPYPFTRLSIVDMPKFLYLFLREQSSETINILKFVIFYYSLLIPLRQVRKKVKKTLVL